MSPALRRSLGFGRIALGLALLWFVVFRAGVSQPVLPILHASWVIAVLVAGAAFGAAVEAQRLQVLFRAQGLDVNPGVAYRVVTMAVFFSFCIPGGTGGDVIKLYYLAARNRRRGVEVATTLLVDRVTGLSALLTLAVALALFNARAVWAHPGLRILALVAAGGLGAIASSIALAWSPRVRASAWYRWALQKLPLRRYAERAVDAVCRFREHKRALIAAYGISLAGQLGTAAVFMALGRVALPSIPSTVVAMLSMMGMTANAVPLTPGGLGVGEAAFEQLFRMLGHEGGAVLLLGWRVALLPLAVLGAVLYIFGAGRVTSGPTRVGEGTGASPDISAVGRTLLADTVEAGAVARHGSLLRE